jgi:arsenate reductase
MLPNLKKNINKILKQNIPEERKYVLQVLIDYIKKKYLENQEIHLNFICTHNSRRSQFAQIWAHTAAAYYNIKVYCYSGGVEVTAFNERAVASIRRSGFEISSEGNYNPIYSVLYEKDLKNVLKCFSKLYDDPVNKIETFAAIMTCAHADQNCPFIQGVEKRISIQYKDPKGFDDTPQEIKKYDERSLQIASEFFYVFNKVTDK